MTEQQQRLKEDFLKPETRDECYIDLKTKCTWKVMLDILEEFDRICRKHDIKYFLIAGSLLGAIRHKGFIPWDDDVDVALLRDDYSRLEKILPDELPSHLFMQTLETDPESPPAHMKIRDSRTTCIFQYEAEQKLCYNMGLYVDVFALEGVPKSKRIEKIFTWLSCRWKDFVRYRNVHVLKGWKSFVKKVAYKFIWVLLGTKLIYWLREKTFAWFKVDNSIDCVQNPCDWGYEHRYRYRVADVRETIEVPFEYLMLKVPKNFDAILTRTYGDWHKKVKGDSIHFGLIQDAKIDYKTILRRDFGYTESMLAKCSQRDAEKSSYNGEQYL